MDQPHIKQRGSRWRKNLPQDVGTPRVSYFKDESGHLRGAVAVVASNGISYVGFSGCHPEDTFSRKIGRAIAIGRAEKALACGFVSGTEKVVVCTNEEAHVVFRFIRKAGFSESMQYKLIGDFLYDTQAVIVKAQEWSGDFPEGGC